MELISRETIKPSPHLTIYPISFIDHILFRNYILLLSFTPQPTMTLINAITKYQCSKILISNPLQILPLRRQTQRPTFHSLQRPRSLIPRHKDRTHPIILSPQPHPFILNPLFPDQLQWKVMDITSSIVAIQINCFACGRIAIGVCMCHEVADVATIFNFVNDWATINREENQGAELPFPVLDAEAYSLLPQGDLPIYPESVFGPDDTVCKRFVFEASKIDSLKAMVSSQHVRDPTRVEVVMALIFKRAVSALGLSFKTSSLRTAVNIRKRMVPPVPEKCVGNMALFMFVNKPVVNSRETELHDLMCKMKESLGEFCDTWAKKLGGKEKDTCFILESLKEATSVVQDSDCGKETKSLFLYSSWCRFPLYEADFGWGKPKWVTTSECSVRNMIFLMDTRDGGGIEVILNMKEEDMARFERDVELLRYASLNPTVVGLANDGLALT